MDELYEAKKEAYENKREKRISGYKRRAGKATQESQAAFKGAHNLADMIPLGQPILVGHHSEKHHRRDAARIDNGMRKGCELQDKAEYYEDKARAAECNQAISSDDPDAIAKLKEKAAALEARHDFHLRCNKEWKKFKAEKAKGNKYSMQLTDEEKAKLLADVKSYPSYQTENQPYPVFVLTNEMAKIRAAKLRIKKLEANNTRNPNNYSYSPEGLPEITVERDVVENRLKIFPPAKAKSFALGLPGIFKRHGFVWAPSNGCYQRKLLNSGRVEHEVIDAIRAVYKLE